MDDDSFRRELYALNERLANGRRSRPEDAVANDPFTSQTADLKAHLSSMHEKLVRYDRSAEPRGLFGGMSPCSDARDSFPDFSALLESCFQQLCGRLSESMRSSFEKLDGRMEALESSLSDLEDRLDGNEWERLTPTGSADGSNATFELPVHGLGQDRDMLVRPEPRFWWESTERAITSPTAVENNKHSTANPKYAHSFLKQPSENYEHVPEPTSGRARENVHIAIARLETQVQELLSRFPNSATKPAEPQSPLSGPKPLLWPQSSRDSLAFRDREIERLDEQLRTAQERLRLSEQSAVALRELSVQSRHERDQLCRSYGELSMRNQYLEQQLHYYRDLIEDRDDAIQEWHTSYVTLQKKTYQDREAEANAYQRGKKDGYEDASKVIDHRLREHDVKIKKLQQVCEDKDIVINHQQEDIERRIEVLNDKDADIHNLRRRIQTIEDQRYDATRTNEDEDDFVSSDYREPKRDEMMEKIARTMPYTFKDCLGSRTNIADAVPRRSPTRRGKTRDSFNRFQESARTLEEGDLSFYDGGRHLRSCPTDLFDRESESQSSIQLGDGCTYEGNRRQPSPSSSGASGTASPSESTHPEWEAGAGKQDSQPRGKQHAADGHATLFRSAPPGPAASRRMASDSDLRGSQHQLFRSNMWAARQPLLRNHSTQGVRGRRWNTTAQSDSESRGDLGGEV